jgi:hypothetical protein
MERTEALVNRSGALQRHRLTNDVENGQLGFDLGHEA